MNRKTIHQYDKSCVYCKSNKTVEVCKNIGDPLKKVLCKYSIYKCKNCSLSFTYPKLKMKDLSFLYGNNYFAKENKLNLLTKIYRFHQYYYDLNEIKKFINKKDRILDYGSGDCSRIEFLNLLKYKNILGVDLYNEPKNNSLKKVFIKNEPLKFKPKNKFDVVFLYHVLEHVDDIDKTIKHIYFDILKKNSILVIQVPNIDTWQFKYFKNKWIGLDVPRHTVHFNEKSLKTIFEKNNFEFLKISKKNSILHPTTIVSSIFNFDIRNKWNKNTKYKFFTYIKYIFLIIVSIPITYIENIFKSSSLVTIILKKN